MTEVNCCTVCGKLFEYDNDEDAYKKYAIKLEHGWDEDYDWEFDNSAEDICSICWLEVKALLRTIKEREAKK